MEVTHECDVNFDDGRDFNVEMILNFGDGYCELVRVNWIEQYTNDFAVSMFERSQSVGLKEEITNKINEFQQGNHESNAD